MAIVEVNTNRTIQYIGLSSDSKPIPITMNSHPHVGEEFYETDTRKWYTFTTSGWILKPALTSIDFLADVELSGERILNAAFDSNAVGDTVLVAIDPVHQVRLFKALFSVGGDIAGVVSLYVGASLVGHVANPKAGGQYMLVSNYPDFYLGSVDSDVIINLPAGGVHVYTNLAYDVVAS